MRLVIVFMLVAIVAFFVAGTTGAAPTLPVAVGFLGLLAAGAALIAEIDAEPGPNRTATRHRPPRADSYGRRTPLTTRESRS
jgi:hypothetical protein